MVAKRTAARPKAEKRAAPAERADKVHLLLYVAGQSARSIAALANLKKLCDAHLEGRYNIEVIDLLEHPHLAKGDNILALLTLVRRLPAPLRKIIGDLSNSDRVLIGLNVLTDKGA